MGATDPPWQVQLASDIKLFKLQGAIDWLVGKSDLPVTSSQRALQYLNFSGYLGYLPVRLRYNLGRYSLARWQVQLASDIKSEGATVLKLFRVNLGYLGYLPEVALQLGRYSFSLASLTCQ